MEESSVIEWPIIGVRNLDESVDYYTRRLLFSPCDKNGSFNETQEIKLKLYDSYLVLKGGGSGPQYECSKKRMMPPKRTKLNTLFKWLGLSSIPTHFREYEKEFNPQMPPLLYFPVPEPQKYFESIKHKGARLISEKSFIYYDFEGFFALDNGGNKVFFFRDHHGPYDPKLWTWGLVAI